VINVKIKKGKKLFKYMYYKILCITLNPRSHGLDPYERSPLKYKLTQLVPGNNNSAVCLSIIIESNGRNYGAWLKRKAKLNKIDCFVYKYSSKRFEAILIGEGLKLEDMLQMAWKGPSKTRVKKVKAKWFNKYVRKEAKNSKNNKTIPWSVKTADAIRKNLIQIAPVLKQANQFKESSEKDSDEIVKAIRNKGYFVMRFASSNYVVSPSKKVGLLSAENSNISTTVRAVSNNKQLTKDIMAYHGLPVPKGAVFSNYKNARDYFFTCDYPVVVKPLEGSMGKGVTVDVRTEEYLKIAWDYAQRYHKVVIIEELVPGVDVRILVIGGTACAALMRVPANIVGDGKKTVRRLINEKNEQRLKNPRLDKKLIKLDAYSSQFLERQNHSLDSIPQKGEIVFLHLKANLAVGGDSIIVTEQINPDLMALAEEASSIFGVNDFWGIDLIVEDIFKTREQKNCKIVEVNSRAALRGVQYPLYGKPFQAPQALINFLFSDENYDCYNSVDKQFKITGVFDSTFLNWVFTQANELEIRGNICLIGSEAKGVISGREDNVLNFLERIWSWEDNSNDMAVDGFYINNYNGLVEEGFKIKKSTVNKQANAVEECFKFDSSEVKENAYDTNDNSEGVEDYDVNTRLYVAELRHQGYQAEVISNELIKICKGNVAGIMGLFHTSSFADNVCKRIFPAKKLLAINNVPVQRGRRFRCKNIRNILSYFNKISKPGIATIMHPDGYQVYSVWEDAQLKKACKKAVKRGIKYMLLEDSPKGTHICIAVVGDNPFSAMIIEPTCLKGDGRNSISNLIEQINNLRKQNPWYNNRLMIIDNELTKYLESLGYHLDYVLPIGEKVCIIDRDPWNGETIVIDNLLHSDFKEKAVEAVKAIPGLEFAFVHMIVPYLDKPADLQNWVVTRIDTTPPVAAFHYPWKGKSCNLVGEVVNKLGLKKLIPTGSNLQIIKEYNTNREESDIYSIINKVKIYHDEKEHLYPIGRRFHYNSRMYLHTGSRKYLDTLQSIKDKWAKSKQWFVENAEYISSAKYIEKELDYEKRYRREALKKHYKIELYNKIFFKALFQESIYGESVNLREIIDHNDVKGVRERLLEDEKSLFLLSTLAVNFLYHYNHFLEDKAFNPEFLFKIGKKKYDIDMNSYLHAIIYFYTHAIIGESRFYTRMFFASTFSLFLQTPSAAATQGNLRVIFH